MSSATATSTVAVGRTSAGCLSPSTCHSSPKKRLLESFVEWLFAKPDPQQGIVKSFPCNGLAHQSTVDIDSGAGPRCVVDIHPRTAFQSSNAADHTAQPLCGLVERRKLVGRCVVRQPLVEPPKEKPRRNSAQHDQRHAPRVIGTQWVIAPGLSWWQIQSAYVDRDEEVTKHSRAGKLEYRTVVRNLDFVGESDAPQFSGIGPRQEGKAKYCTEEPAPRGS